MHLTIENLDTNFKYAHYFVVLNMKIIILGLGPAGLFAAINAKKTNPKADITIVEKRPYDTYSPCGLPFVLEGKIKTCEELKHAFPAEEMGIKKLTSHEVLSINTKDKTVNVKDLNYSSSKPKNSKTNNPEIDLAYDKLIYALGSESLIPPIEGANLKGVFRIDNPENTTDANNYVKEGMDAIILGAGAVGLECAVALKKARLNVTVIEMQSHGLFNAADEDMAKLLDEYIASEGINLIFNKKVDKIVEKKGSVGSVFVSGKEMPADVVLMASGVRPNIKLAQDAGIEIGDHGIKTNELMQTSDPDIYAAGDCAQIQNFITKRPWQMRLAVAAYQEGKTAGINAAGGSGTYKGALTTFVSKIGDMEIASTGFNEMHAKEAGFKALAVKAKGFSRMPWYPGNEPITLKVIFDKDTQKIIGAQALGKEGAAARINVISTAIRAGFTAQDLAAIELAYCPAVSETFDVINKAGEEALRILSRG